jgi:hypothetical protein
MSNHDHSHPKWEIPPPEPRPHSAAQPSAPSTGGMPLIGAATDVRARRSRRGSRRPSIRPVRALVAATVGLGLLLGGGVAGVAVVAADGPDGGPGVTVLGAVNDHRVPGMEGVRAGRGN